MHWRDKLKKAVFAGEAKVLDRKTYVLEVRGVRPATLYFDQQTHLLIRKDSKWEQSQVEAYYSDYAETAGVKLPMKVGYFISTRDIKYLVNTTELKVNVPLEDAIFAMPTH